MQGECLKIMDNLVSEGVTVDAVIADPPYGTTACKWASVIPFEDMWLRLNAIIKPNGAIVLFGSEPFSSALRMSNIKSYKYDWIWSKNKVTGFLNAKKQPMHKHEIISVFYNKQSTYNPQMKEGCKPVNSYTKHTSDGSTVGKTKKGIKGGGSTKRYPVSVLDFAIVNQDGTNDGGNFHPTQKPLALMEYLIKTYTNEGDTVIDFTMGSGSTGVSCVHTNRNFIGIELDKNYFKIAEKRINENL